MRIISSLSCLFQVNAFLPVYVNHKQHRDRFRLHSNRPDRVPALLSRYGIDAVPNDQARLVLEDEGGQLEGDSAVFPLVSQILRFVPLVLQFVYTQCITESAPATAWASLTR
jgi:hypothetical protein